MESTLEQRWALHFSFLLKKTVLESQVMLIETYGDDTMSLSIESVVQAVQRRGSQCPQETSVWPIQIRDKNKVIMIVFFDIKEIFTENSSNNVRKQISTFPGHFETSENKNEPCETEVSGDHSWRLRQANVPPHTDFVYFLK